MIFYSRDMTAVLKGCWGSYMGPEPRHKKPPPVIFSCRDITEVPRGHLRAHMGTLYTTPRKKN